MIGIYIGFGLMTFAALLALYGNRRLTKALARANDLIKAQSEIANEQFRYRVSEIVSRLGKAEIEETTKGILSEFTVYRKGFGDLRHEIASFHYDPSDPDDRDYKRICAEELADALNEEP